VVYVGDGGADVGRRGRGGDRGPVEARGGGHRATFHAVTTSASYEAVVLEALASVGGGSVRRAEARRRRGEGAAREVARPGLRGAKVEIQGVPTAKVYPETLPNAPLGTQQVVLGRFLPGATASTATVVVTGTVAGQPVRFTSPLAVPAADEGNSFLPRLWARRHLDVLLAQGRSPVVQEEVVAFSREYQIMTPYTSFLVLENDEDRATYGVERTVKCAASASSPTPATRRRSRSRGNDGGGEGWRLGLPQSSATSRRDRGVPTPVAEGWVLYEEESISKEWVPGSGGRSFPDFSGSLHSDGHAAGAKTGDWSGDGYEDFAARTESKDAERSSVPPGLREPMGASRHPTTPMSQAGCRPALRDAAMDDALATEDAEESDADAPAEESLDKAREVSRRVADRKQGTWSRRGLGQATTANWNSAYRFAGLAGRGTSAEWEGGADRSGASYDAAALGFPGLGAPPKPPEDETDPKDWPADVVARCARWIGVRRWPCSTARSACADDRFQPPLGAVAARRRDRHRAPLRDARRRDAGRAAHGLAVGDGALGARRRAAARPQARGRRRGPRLGLGARRRSLARRRAPVARAAREAADRRP
jgi:hypothetical protein